MLDALQVPATRRAAEDVGARILRTRARGPHLEPLAGHRVVVVEAAVDAPRRRAWVDGVMAARAAWTEDFGGEQYALGRAFYTHLETGRSAEYFAAASASDALVERWAPGLQASMRALLGAFTGARVRARRGWCGAGVHVFPAREKVAEAGGVVHYDVEGLGRHHLARRRPALSLVLMLQTAERGGGLRLWDARYDGQEHATDADLATDGALVDYADGDLFVFDSYRLHQIQPFAGARPRVSATLHAAEVDRGLWECWF
jgi:hypothetical protein